MQPSIIHGKEREYDLTRLEHRFAYARMLAGLSQGQVVTLMEWQKEIGLSFIKTLETNVNNWAIDASVEKLAELYCVSESWLMERKHLPFDDNILHAITRIPEKDRDAFIVLMEIMHPMEDEANEN